jgi:hypothetical protein
MQRFPSIFEQVRLALSSLSVRPAMVLSRRKLHPHRAGAGAGYGGFDEGHAFDAVFDGGEIQIGRGFEKE